MRPMKNKHLILMLIGCVLPLLLIFFAPALGIDGDTGLLAFILLMFLCHILMPHSHGNQRHHNHKNEKQ
ncbi:MAG: hypothetical protein CMN32_06480 [Saprospirales bacterium]|nr:hypothetical protein [Saprospirales bacterium]